LNTFISCCCIYLMFCISVLLQTKASPFYQSSSKKIWKPKQLHALFLHWDDMIDLPFQLWGKINFETSVMVSVSASLLKEMGSKPVWEEKEEHTGTFQQTEFLQSWNLLLCWVLKLIQIDNMEVWQQYTTLLWKKLLWNQDVPGIKGKLDHKFMFLAIDGLYLI
jgi:hypothetical protein